MRVYRIYRCSGEGHQYLSVPSTLAIELGIRARLFSGYSRKSRDASVWYLFQSGFPNGRANDLRFFMEAYLLKCGAQLPTVEHGTGGSWISAKSVLSDHTYTHSARDALRSNYLSD